MHDKLADQPADTILVVEDEVLVRMVIADYLRDCGYRVFEAGIVDEAIEVLVAESRIGIMFTDIQMPGDRDGFDLCRWVQTNMPHIKVILTSGGVKAANVVQDLCHAGLLMRKPYYLHMVVARPLRARSETGVGCLTARSLSDFPPGGVLIGKFEMHFPHFLGRCGRS